MKTRIKGALIAIGIAVSMPATATMLTEWFTNNSNFGFTYGTWNGQVTPGVDFITVSGSATEQGGAGTTGLGPFDLTPYLTNGTIQIDARLGSGNLADNFNIILLSSPTDLAGYQFSASLLNNSTFTTVSMLLTNPTFTSGTIDWTAVNEFQIQGDFSGTAQLDMQFRYLIVPEPSTVLLFGAGLVALALRRRAAMTMNDT